MVAHGIRVSSCDGSSWEWRKRVAWHVSAIAVHRGGSEVASIALEVRPVLCARLLVRVLVWARGISIDVVRWGRLCCV